MSVLKINNPYSGDPLGEFPLESLNDVKTKVEALNKTQKTWKSCDIHSRITLIQSALNYFEENAELIAKDISEQMGRPQHQAKNEIYGMLDRAHYLISVAVEALLPEEFNDQAGFYRAIEHVPLGTIFVISAWNYPLLITINSVIPSLLAGNTVLLKHSSLTPKIGEHFQKAFHSLGDYTDLLFSTVVDHKTTGEIIEQLGIDHVVFTGSVNGGRQIVQHTSKRFINPTLELGGKDGVYLHNDANLEAATESIIDGAFFNSGQSCCGLERAYIHADVYDEFIERATKLVEAYRLGNPTDSNTSMGPLAQGRAAEYMQKQIDDAKAAGAKVLTGGESFREARGTFFRPTLVTDVTNDMEIMQEENFGPIVGICKVNSMEEALTHINDSNYGLTSAIYTSNQKTAKTFAKEANTGTVFMNRCDYLDPALAWVGVKNSGQGFSLSKFSFHSVTRKKSIHFKID